MPKTKVQGRFTSRQKELLIWFARDCSYELAAIEMGITIHGVKSLMDAMHEHFNIHTGWGLLGHAFKTKQIMASDI